MKKLMRILLILSTLFVLSLQIHATAAEGSFSNFTKTTTYTSGRFEDVPAGAWFEEGIKTAYELGLVNGTSESTFNPDGNISVAEVLALACRINSTYNSNSIIAAQSGPWYQSYVDYAIENGIIYEGQFPDYTALVTRAEFATIMSASLPDKAWVVINVISTPPADIDPTSFYAGPALKLYSAGVLTGSDSYGTFLPLSNIQRSEVSTIVTRMAVPALRKTFTLLEKPVDVDAISLDGPTSVNTWDTITLTPTIFPNNATDKSVTWNSSNWGVASVSPEGVVTGMQAGSATISATTANGKVATKDITVQKLPSVSAPTPTNIYNGVPEDSSMLFKDKSGFGFYVNSVNGINVCWIATNLSGKTINYYTCYFSLFNPVGDPAYDEITRKSTVSTKTVGPVLPGDSLLVMRNIAYNGVCSKVVLDRIDLEYADGTKETVYYGYSGYETLWNKYYNKF